MKSFVVVMSDEAYHDLSDLVDVITNQYKSPLTAFKYGNELKAKIKTLEKNADLFKIEKEDYYLPFGSNIRRINYKKMAVLYSIKDDNVFNTK